MSSDEPVDEGVSQPRGRPLIHKQDATITGSFNEISPEQPHLSTGIGGKRSDCDPDHVDRAERAGQDLASDALASARAISAVRGGAERARLRRRRRDSGAPAAYSGARPDDRDPQPIGAILGRSLPELGWVGPLATARLLGQWQVVVGDDIAAHCQPLSLADGELRIAAESTAWATQLRLMAPRILAKIAAEMPAGMVTKLIITGPSGPSWKRGPWAMRGGRGVRDTYG